MKRKISEISQPRDNESIDQLNKKIKANPQIWSTLCLQSELEDKLIYLNDAFLRDLDLTFNSFNYVSQCNMKIMQGNLKGAIAEATEAIRLNPNSSLVFSTRGWAKLKLGLLDGAVDDLTVAIRLNPNDSTAYCTRGRVKFRLGILGSAVDDLNEAIRLNPDDGMAFYSRGSIKRQLGDYQDGAADLAKGEASYLQFMEKKQSNLYNTALPGNQMFFRKEKNIVARDHYHAIKAPGFSGG